MKNTNFINLNQLPYDHDHNSPLSENITAANTQIFFYHLQLYISTYNVLPPARSKLNNVSCERYLFAWVDVNPNAIPS